MNSRHNTLCRFRGLALTALGAAVIAGCGGAPEAPASTAVAYEGAQLIIGDGSDPIADAVIVVDGGVITAAGPASAVTAPDGAERVDLSGRFVIPALVDTHVHFRVPREELVDDLHRRAYYGVGLGLSLGHDGEDTAFEVRDLTIPGAARSMTAGRGITRPEPGRSEVPYWIDTPEEAREAVRELAAQGVDIVKLWVDDRNGQYEKLTPEIYGPAIEEAHAHGLRVAAHIFDLEDAKGLLEAGVDAFAHSVRDMDVDDEFVTMVQEQPDVTLMANLGSRGAHEDVSWLSGTIPADELEALQGQYQERPEIHEAFAIQARNLVRLHEAGMKIVMGTDGNGGYRPHIEMRDMVEAGMSPHDVLVASTGLAAEFLGRGDEVGTIEAGKSADFVVLEADPLADIMNTRRIEAVYLRGERVDREGLSAGWVGQ